MAYTNINQIIVNEESYNKDNLIYRLLIKHLRMQTVYMVNPIMNLEIYKDNVFISSLKLVEQLHQFKSYYLLIHELDKKYNEICDLKIDGLIISSNSEKKKKVCSIDSEMSCDINNIGCNTCSCNDRKVFSENIYENIMRMYNEYYKYDNKKTYLNIPSNEMMQRYQEIVQLYETEEMNLYNCINDFNMKMSEFLVANNKERIRSKFMAGIKD